METVAYVENVPCNAIQYFSATCSHVTKNVLSRILIASGVLQTGEKEISEILYFHNKTKITTDNINRAICFVREIAADFTTNSKRVLYDIFINLIN